MKKTYEKPTLSAVAKLAQSTATLGKGISYFVCGADLKWDSELQECYDPDLPR